MQYEANHPVVGDSTIVCDTKYYTAVSSAHCLVACSFLLCMKTLCAHADSAIESDAYSQVEDRPIVKEIKTYIREHHPIEKEFVVETRPTGESHCAWY